ncbi:MAG: hypothetical protein CMJ75_22030 [Planctomycetaceae bacterium]|nr:hypothetical protein [Planctomycetaceae bacterium]
MGLLIGTDEAGYGPNLGPLVVAATVWRTSTAMDCQDLYERLDDVVCRTPLPRTDQRKRLPVADSKQLYRPGSDWGHLERAVLAALSLTGGPVHNWTEVWPAVDRENAILPPLPWYTDFQISLPRDIAAADVDWWRTRLCESLPARGVELVGVLARVVFPEEFNRRVDATGSKGTLLSEATLQLISKCREFGAGDWVTIRCDKHGGRSRYGPLLQETFPEYLIEVVCEGREQSVYRWGPANERVEIGFVTGGEQFLPAALASMTAKYLRELAMFAFNQFWTCLLPGLRPTAGYPVDAKRFKEEIETTQRQLGIADDSLWRKR